MIDVFDRKTFRTLAIHRQSLQQGTLMLLLDGLDEVNSAVARR
jgi:hypothetical protein